MLWNYVRIARIGFVDMSKTVVQLTYVETSLSFLSLDFLSVVINSQGFLIYKFHLAISKMALAIEFEFSWFNYF